MADIIDVQMFTTQLQRELADNITPELKKVTYITKDFNKNIQNSLSEFASRPMSEVTDLTNQLRDYFLDANSDANIEITGDEKIAKMPPKEI